MTELLPILERIAAALEAQRPARQVMDAGQLADYLGISESKVRAQTAEYKIPHKRIEGQVRYFRPVIDEWLREGTITSAAEHVAWQKANSAKGERPGLKEAV